MALKTDIHSQALPLTQTSTASESVGGDDFGRSNKEEADRMWRLAELGGRRSEAEASSDRGFVRMWRRMAAWLPRPTNE
uniref:Uncharacterized protein n=1 Tax=Cucumis melo TaxID=3656 RepID=A0A9I9D618_CUCME